MSSTLHSVSYILQCSLYRCQFSVFILTLVLNSVIQCLFIESSITSSTLASVYRMQYRCVVSSISLKHPVSVHRIQQFFVSSISLPNPESVYGIQHKFTTSSISMLHQLSVCQIQYELFQLV